MWTVPSLQEQPSITLVRWSVARLVVGELSADLLFGYDLANGCGRVSTAVAGIVPGTGMVMTASGRIYVLEGLPAIDADGFYVFRQTVGPGLAAIWVDVAQEYVASTALARIAATGEPA
jgi:hypothetical protein